MKTVFTALLFTLLCTCGRAQGSNIVLLEESLVAPDGLYFAGDRGVDYQFGPQISAHGDCIKVSNGYIFVTWYQGGMDKRFLRLSRRRLNDPTAPWVTLEFPDQHIGYQGNPTIGDSHNTIAVAISEVDGRVHLLYDMHAYAASQQPDNYFNYRISDEGAAFLPDEAFTIDKFSAKRNYLKAGLNYERTTYPTFFETSDGQILVEYRIGGAGNGDFFLSRYDGTEWQAPYIFTDGTIPLPNRYSEYGGKRAIGDKLYAGFSVRYAQDDRYQLNSGFHFAQAVAPYGPDDWSDVNGNPIPTPIQGPDHLLIGEPEEDYGTADAPRTSSSPDFIVTDNGSIHFIGRVDNQKVHYWRGAQDTVFSSAVGGDIPSNAGSLFAFGADIIVIDLNNGYPVVKRAPAGTNNWETVYSANEGRRFQHFKAVVADGKLYAYLHERGDSKANPLYLQTYSLGFPTATESTSLAEQLVCYPNPANREIYVLPITLSGNYQLYDLKGRRLREGKLTGNPINVSQLKNGAYLLRIRTSSSSTVTVRKVLINN